MDPGEAALYELVAVDSPDDWATYHRIRREELFEARGRYGIYDSNRTDERLHNHFPLLLKYDGTAVATVRLDVHEGNIAVVRLVAVTRSEQSKGHGRILGKCIEEFARRKGVRKLVVNAAPDAVGYYQRLGFSRETWDGAELKGVLADAVQMAKRL
jgi:N-acetylglutamate synthase-like GNAT family acetyltransferase